MDIQSRLHRHRLALRYKLNEVSYFYLQGKLVITLYFLQEVIYVYIGWHIKMFLINTFIY